MHKHLIAFTIALATGFAGSAFAANAMSRDAYKAAKESEAAFSRAFTREYGASPGSWPRGAAS